MCPLLPVMSAGSPNHIKQPSEDSERWRREGGLARVFGIWGPTRLWEPWDFFDPIYPYLSTREATTLKCQQEQTKHQKIKIKINFQGKLAPSGQNLDKGQSCRVKPTVWQMNTSQKATPPSTPTQHFTYRGWRQSPVHHPCPTLRRRHPTPALGFRLRGL